MAMRPELMLPADFDEYAFEVESKGIFWDVTLRHEGHEYPLTFYEPRRLAQDIEEELTEGTLFFEPNLIVVKKVTKEAMNAAVQSLAQQGKLTELKPI